MDFYKEEKGKKQSRKRSVKSRVALLTSGTFNLQLERWCREFDSQIARPTEHHLQIVQRSLLHSASAGFSFNSRGGVESLTRKLLDPRSTTHKSFKEAFLHGASAGFSFFSRPLISLEYPACCRAAATFISPLIQFPT